METTRYSDKIPGNQRNYGWAVEFDITGPKNYATGYLGITQFDENGNLKERVLLSPHQLDMLMRFIGAD